MKRRIIAILAFLLFGAIVNVAVAWGCALWPRRQLSNLDPADLYEAETSGVHGPRNEELISLEPFSDLARERQRLVALGWRSFDRWHHPKYELFRCTHIGPGVVRRRITDNVAPAGPTGLSWSLFPVCNQLYAGWPKLTLFGEEFQYSLSSTGDPVESRYDASWKNNWSVKVPTELGSIELAPDGLLPLRPLWPGAAVNTLLYAAVVWLLWSMPFAARRVIRIKRGRCPKCGYPAGESPVCTECGSDLPRGLTERDHPPPRSD